MTTTAQLYSVEVRDRCSSQLVGHDGCSYASPPQPAEQALTLVRVLLGCPQRALTLAGGPGRPRSPADSARSISTLALPDGQ